MMGHSAHWVDQAVRHQLERSNLTAERERMLLRLAHADGNGAMRHAAVTELWESHSKLVVAIAHQYRRSGVELLDLVGAGHLGLYKAIERFDPSRVENRLAAYAASWIRYFVRDFVRRNASLIRLPESTAHRQLVQMHVQLFADARRACLREGADPTDSALGERIGKRIGMAPAEVMRTMRLLAGGMLSLHGADEGEQGAMALQDTLPDEDALSEDDMILRLDEAKARRRIVALAAEILGERERKVFFARCLPETGDPCPLDVLAATFGVTRERVHQIEGSARRKITTALSKEGFTGPIALPAAETPVKPPASGERRRQPCDPAPVSTASGD